MNICKHFSQCGGCRFQDIDYLQQLKNKEDRARALLAKSSFDARIKPINFSDCWYYRNKMEFSFSKEDGKIICGLYSKLKKRRVIDLRECLIFSKDFPRLIKAIGDFLNKKNYSVHDTYTHQGFLRNLIIRESKSKNQIMVALITSSQEALDVEGFVKVLRDLNLEFDIASIFHIVNDSLSDAVIFEDKKLLFGEEFLIEELDGLKFKIGVDTFFQVNPKMIEGFYNKVRDYAKLKNQEKVLDLFCGVGSIGIFLAQKAKKVFGVEISPEIIEKARENAQENNIENIDFCASDVRRFLNIKGSPFGKPDFVVVNPPRGGLSNKVKRAILRLNSPKIIYSSCNPESLFRDLEAFKEQYKLDFIEPFDFFPHTPHLEVLALLKIKATSTLADSEISPKS